MNTLTCLGAFIAAAVFATPISTVCCSIGFAGIAAVAGAALVVALIPGGMA